MPKREEQDVPKHSQPGKRERMPPPLSTDLIAQLQAAVDAAQRKRLREHRTEADRETDQ